MLFDITPKERKADIFDFEEEYGKFKQALKNKERLIIIQGLRRTGKTSLMKVVYNEIDDLKLFVDTREIIELTPKTTIDYFQNELLKIIEKEKLSKLILKYIREINIGQIGINVNQKYQNLSELAKELNQELISKKKHLYIFIDEAQNLHGTYFDNFIAFCFDNLHSFSFVLSGSEMKLLEEFISFHGKTPLFGRGRVSIKTRRLLPRESKRFLNDGFKQLKKDINEDELETTVESLDGIIGWLTLYGHYRKTNTSKKALELVLQDARIITQNEITKFLDYKKRTRNKYLQLLKVISEKPLTWSEIKIQLNLISKQKTYDSRLSEYINTLLEFDIIEKVEDKYHITDPLTKEGIRQIKR